MAHSKTKYGTHTLFRTLRLCYGLSHWLDTKSLQQKTCLWTNDHAKRRPRNDRRSTQRLGTTGDPRIDTSCLDGRRRNRREARSHFQPRLAGCPTDKSEQRKRGNGGGMGKCLQAVDWAGSRSCLAIVNKSVCEEILLIPEFCPEGQRQRLTVNNSILLVENDSKKASKPIESPHSMPGPCIQQNSLLVATWSDFIGTEQATHARSWDFLLSPCQKCRKKEELMSISRLGGHM